MHRLPCRSSHFWRRASLRAVAHAFDYRHVTGIAATCAHRLLSRTHRSGTGRRSQRARPLGQRRSSDSPPTPAAAPFGALPRRRRRRRRCIRDVERDARSRNAHQLWQHAGNGHKCNRRTRKRGRLAQADVGPLGRRSRAASFAQNATGSVAQSGYMLLTAARSNLRYVQLPNKA